MAGFPDGASAKGAAAAAAAHVARARDFYQALAPLAAGLRAEGRSLRAIARELEARGFKTRQELTRWNTTQVRRLLARAGADRGPGAGPLTNANNGEAAQVEPPVPQPVAPETPAPQQTQPPPSPPPAAALLAGLLSSPPPAAAAKPPPAAVAAPEPDEEPVPPPSRWPEPPGNGAAVYFTSTVRR